MLLAQKPADRDAMVGLIDTASASGDMDTARAVAQQAIQTHPADYRVYMAAARMAQTRGSDGDAARYLKTARALYMRETGMAPGAVMANRSEEHTSELQSLMRISYAVFCLKKKK